MPSKNKIGGSKKGRQSTHNKLTGKYTRQFARTAANKERRIARQKARSRAGADN